MKFYLELYLNVYFTFKFTTFIDNIHPFKLLIRIKGLVYFGVQ